VIEAGAPVEKIGLITTLNDTLGVQGVDVAVVLWRDLRGVIGQVGLGVKNKRLASECLQVNINIVSDGSPAEQLVSYGSLVLPGHSTLKTFSIPDSRLETERGPVRVIVEVDKRAAIDIVVPLQTSWGQSIITGEVSSLSATDINVAPADCT